MLKRPLYWLAPLFFVLLIACNQNYNTSTFQVKGRYLYDTNGEKVVLRGVNKMIIWRDMDGDTAMPEIWQTGANCVRIVWTTQGRAGALDTVIACCIQNHMIPMIECHDATGKWENLPMILDYWTRPEIVAVIQKHQKFLLLNIANECGEFDVPADTFRTVYQRAVQNLRSAGIHVPLIIDGTDWGKNIDILQSEGPAIIAGDPDHNLMFSVHMWWPAMWGYDAARVRDELQESADMGLPLIVGEFGHQWEDSEQGVIPYMTILRECQRLQIGWLAWSWGPGNRPQTFLDMTKDGTFATLHGWGQTVVEAESVGMRQTSVRPKSLLSAQR